MNQGSTVRERWVRCPCCGQQARYAAENPARPFCSVRCRSIDLGAWSSESYRVDAASATDDPDETQVPDAKH